MVIIYCKNFDNYLESGLADFDNYVVEIDQYNFFLCVSLPYSFIIWDICEKLSESLQWITTVNSIYNCTYILYPI